MHLGLADGDIDVREGPRSLLESVGLRVWAQVILAPRRESIIKLAIVLSEAGELDKDQRAALLAS